MAQLFRTPEERAQRAWDEVAIMRTLARLSRAQDDNDPVAYRNAFTDMVLIEQPMLPGWTPKLVSADEWTRVGPVGLAGFDVTQHMLSNHVIEVEGDEATCVVDLRAYHELKDGPDAGILEIGGRYHLRLRRDGDEWRICERAFVVRYRAGDQALFDKMRARLAARTGKT